MSIDNSKTMVKCGIKDSAEPFPIESIGIKINDYYFDDMGAFKYQYFFSDRNEYLIKQILSSCMGESNRYNILSFDIYLLQRVNEILNNGKSKSEQDALILRDGKLIESAHYSFEKEKYLDFSRNLFDIIPQYTYIPFLVEFVISNMIVIAALELLRRIFYYIVLGKFRPPKTEQDL
jgi:hypothetical protein